MYFFFFRSFLDIYLYNNINLVKLVFYLYKIYPPPKKKVNGIGIGQQAKPILALSLQQGQDNTH